MEIELQSTEMSPLCTAALRTAAATSTTGAQRPNLDVTRKKRTYTYHKRTKGNWPQRTEKATRFNAHSEANVSSFDGLKCCEWKQCFNKVNLDHMVEKSKLVMHMNKAERRHALSDMLTSSGVFMFDGTPVCAEFLVQAFCCSHDIQCAFKKTLGAEISKLEPAHSRGPNYTASRDSIAVFLRRLADQTVNKMPDKDDVHLPFYDKKEVYSLFCDQYKAIEKRRPPSSSNFHSVWHSSLLYIKIRRVTRLMLCPVCES